MVFAGSGTEMKNKMPFVCHRLNWDGDFFEGIVVKI